MMEQLRRGRTDARFGQTVEAEKYDLTKVSCNISCRITEVGIAGIDYCTRPIQDNSDV